MAPIICFCGLPVTGYGALPNNPKCIEEKHLFHKDCFPSGSIVICPSCNSISSKILMAKAEVVKITVNEQGEVSLGEGIETEVISLAPDEGNLVVGNQTGAAENFRDQITPEPGLPPPRAIADVDVSPEIHDIPSAVVPEAAEEGASAGRIVAEDPEKSALPMKLKRGRKCVPYEKKSMKQFTCDLCGKVHANRTAKYRCCKGPFVCGKCGVACSRVEYLKAHKSKFNH